MGSQDLELKGQSLRVSVPWQAMPREALTQGHTALSGQAEGRTRVQPLLAGALSLSTLPGP